jgi:hypothetical protein
LRFSARWTCLSPGDEHWQPHGMSRWAASVVASLILSCSQGAVPLDMVVRNAQEATRANSITEVNYRNTILR